MKTTFLLVCLLCIGTLSQAQQLSYGQTARSGAIYVFVAPDNQWAGDGFPPKFDPHAISPINPSYINPIEGSGPYGLDPTLGTGINPYLNFVVDGIDPGPGPLKRKIIEPEFLNPIDGLAPVTGDPRMKRKISAAFLVVHD